MSHRKLTLSVKSCFLISTAVLAFSGCVAEDDGSGVMSGLSGEGGGPATEDTGAMPGVPSPTGSGTTDTPTTGVGPTPTGQATPEPVTTPGSSTPGPTASSPGSSTPEPDPSPTTSQTMPSGPVSMGMGGMDMLGMGGMDMGIAGMGVGGMDLLGMGGVGIGDMGMGGMGMGGMGMGGMDMGIAGMPGAGMDDLNSGENTMGWTGCSMGENTAIGYRRIGGTRMWGSNGNGGAVVQQWTSSNSAAWGRFDNLADMHGKPVAVWIMICIFAQAGATAQEVTAMIENAREHSAPDVVIYLTGQPVYTNNHVCQLAGPGGPEMTDELARTVADQHDDVIYPGQLVLEPSQTMADTCHANQEGEDALGQQAKAYWGQP